MSKEDGIDEGLVGRRDGKRELEGNGGRKLIKVRWSLLYIKPGVFPRYFNAPAWAFQDLRHQISVLYHHRLYGDGDDRCSRPGRHELWA